MRDVRRTRQPVARGTRQRTAARETAPGKWWRDVGSKEGSHLFDLHLDAVPVFHIELRQDVRQQARLVGKLQEERTV